MTPDERIELSRKQTTPARRLAYFFSPDFPGWSVPAHAIVLMDENYQCNERYRLQLDKWGANPLWSAVAHALLADLINREKATEAAPYIEPWWAGNVGDTEWQPVTEIYEEMAAAPPEKPNPGYKLMPGHNPRRLGGGREE